MNALDLLVDFTTLISTSVELTPREDENASVCIGSSHDKGAPLLASERLLPFEQYLSTQQAPKEIAPRDVTANPRTRQIVSPSASYVYDCEMIDDGYQSVPPPSMPHGHHTMQTFDAYRQENPNIDPPSKLTSIPQQPWPQQSGNQSQWAMRHDVDPALTSVLDTWYDAQISCAFEPPQHQNAPHRHVQIPCPNPPSQCWTQSPQSHYPAEDAWPSWNTAEAPFDHGFLPEYNEWTLPGTRLNTG